MTTELLGWVSLAAAGGSAWALFVVWFRDRPMGPWLWSVVLNARLSSPLIVAAAALTLTSLLLLTGSVVVCSRV